MSDPVVVIGAGAAGLMAAAWAATGPRPVLLLERTKDGGRKILIAGGGRCNVLPSQLDERRFVTDSSPNTLRLMLRSWPLAEQRRFFEEEVGIPLALEAETGKLFPVSNRARDVRDGLVALCRRRGVTLRFETLVSGLVPPGAPGGPWRVELEGAPSLRAAAVILATGGLSVPTTGSDGAGLRLARALGHALHEPYAALTPLVCEPPPYAALAGVSLTARLEASVDGKPWRTEGGFLFTHRGYSGPGVLDASHLAVRARRAGTPQPLHIRWTMHDAAAWERLLGHAGGAGSTLVRTVLARELPERLALALQADAGVPGDMTLAQLTRDGRRALIRALTAMPLPWTGDEGYRKAEVTGGGVALGEVDARTLESRRTPGLFLCGELLDAFGPIGGYNFYWAWATGRAAGLGAAALPAGAPTA
ncbi:MAG: aminoacetone oxidase family FAD-binding enzyme [Gemmatimonadales bacterium]|nr:aminoacetone oxidase family FAD-binding enzyme [Gemmatimonadales bacterium]